MILLIAFAVVILRLFYSIAEAYFEKSWPSRTIGGLVIAITIFCFCAGTF
jgi:hypothetical protein